VPASQSPVASRDRIAAAWWVRGWHRIQSVKNWTGTVFEPQAEDDEQQCDRQLGNHGARKDDRQVIIFRAR
jgi:hypothetical protein